MPVRYMLTGLTWFACLIALLTASAQVFAQRAWVIDQAAVAAPQMTLAATVLLLIPLALRKWICIVVSASMVLVSTALFAPGRAPSAPAALPDNVSVLTINALGMNPTPDLVVDMIAASNVDVVTIVECSWELWSMLQSDDRILEAFPYGSGPAHPKEWSRVKLSKWPLRPIDLEKDDRWDVMKWNYLFRRSHIIERPGAEFILGAFVVRSPRSAEDWRSGNDQLIENCTVIREYLSPLGLPIVIGADLNATPSSARTDILRDVGGLYRTKPWAVPVGTWPASNPRWARVAIDDILVSRGVSVASWESVEFDTGSDHVAVRALLALSQATPPENR